jgi:hypothetical protein
VWSVAAVWPPPCLSVGRTGKTTKEAATVSETNSNLSPLDRYEAPANPRAGWKLLLVALAATAIGINMYLMAKVTAVEDGAEVQRQRLEREVAELRERVGAKRTTESRELAALRAEIEQTRRQAHGQARAEARREAQATLKLVNGKHNEQQEMLLGELGAMRDTADGARAGLTNVQGEVAAVRGEVDATRRELDETSDVLARSREEWESVAGLAENAALGLAELRRLGEREATPFALAVSKDRSRIGDIQLRLRAADPGKNRYSVEIFADDRSTQHKDRALNEAVEFYVEGADRPYELVVTKITKGRVSGLLRRPAGQALARN